MLRDDTQILVLTLGVLFHWNRPGVALFRRDVNAAGSQKLTRATCAQVHRLHVALKNVIKTYLCEMSFVCATAESRGVSVRILRPDVVAFTCRVRDHLTSSSSTDVKTSCVIYVNVSLTVGRHVVPVSARRCASGSRVAVSERKDSGSDGREAQSARTRGRGQRCLRSFDCQVEKLTLVTFIGARKYFCVSIKRHWS